tara:strand:+ start:251 stop:625 length:375 start_codon:yes stop_codon:yes gene_type:complete
MLTRVQEILCDVRACFLLETTVLGEGARAAGYFDYAYRSVYCASRSNAEEVQRVLREEIASVAKMPGSRRQMAAWTQALCDVFLYHDKRQPLSARIPEMVKRALVEARALSSRSVTKRVGVQRQ